ncbi:MAG TPA: TonB-dependent receptor plug domain-containing protein, partial [Candidatus Didemnitutus sp.]|nr:TonB-dependent receptor plug domain-containing protein [Candidatus Didemnitutus sp.]
MLLHSGVRHLQVSLLALLMAAPAIAQEVKKEPAAPANAAEPNKAQSAAIADASKTAALEKKDEPVQLSPFTVTTNRDQGYFAANTLAGSRMNTNIADLAASISVITKQQMADTGSIDVNDVFRYEANTEGSSTYTAATGTFRNDGFLDVNAGGTQGNNVSSFTNATANRVRGIGVPSSAVNYYPAIGQIPLDSYNVQSVEISRGPNSMLFGLGSPAGIVNQSVAQAALNKSSTNVTVRFDQYGSYRGSLSFNRGLIDDKLAIYGAFLYDNRQFDRKPSYDLTRRQYGAFTFKPFSKTTLSGFVEGYSNDNRRPNTLTPRDFVTQWNLAGQPVYDSQTRQFYRLSDNKILGSYIINASSPYAQESRSFITSMSGYNPALRGGAPSGQTISDTNFTTYNGVSIFGDAAITASGFAYNKTPSANALFVPGVARVNQARSLMQIADGQLVNWFQPLYGTKYATSWPTAPAGPPLAGPPATTTGPSDANIWLNPTWAAIDNRDFYQSSGFTGINNGIVGYKYPGVTNSAIYDWRKVNINQMNFGHDKNTNYNLEFNQDILDNLYFNAGWFRQDFDSQTNYTVAQLNVTTLFVDINKYLPDGTPNPYFGKPYVYDQDPDQYINAELDDHYRAMLAWTPDFTQKAGWMKWLGHHQILGLWSKDDYMGTSYRRRLEYLDSSSQDGKFRYMANQNPNNDGSPTGWNYQTTSLQRAFYLAAPQDPNGIVTRSSGTWDPLRFGGDIKVYDYNNSRFTTVNMTTVFNDFDAGTGRAQRIVDSISGGWTAYLWNDRFIGTFGVRQDKYKARVTNTANTQVTDSDGTVLSPAITNAQKWVNGFFQEDFLFNRWGRWDKMDGTTRTLGGVLRPFQHWGSIDSRAQTGSVWWQFVRDFGVSYNQSDNFNPPSLAQVDPFGNPLPKPTGTGKDYGFQFSLFDNKLFARVTWFEASNENERVGANPALLSRMTDNVDQTLFR